MAKTIDYYLALMSPWAYLGGEELAAIAKRHGAAINVYPVQLGKIFPVSGGLPLAKRAKQRQDYRLIELARWRDYRKMKLNLHPKHFPGDETMAARMTVAAREAGQDALKLSNAIQRAVWAEEKNIADPATLKQVVADAGFDAEALAKAAEDPAVQAIYDADTERAIERGVFGSPTYIIDGDLFWGQDRLDFVDRKLAG